MRFLGLRVLGTFLLLFLVACGGGGSEPGPIGGGSTWEYVALGDSVAAGIGASQGYVPRYRDHIITDTDHDVVLLNLGVPGWTSTDLYNAVRNDPNFRAAISEAEVVTWNIGGNDMLGARNRFTNGTCGGTDNQDCLRETVAQFRTNWDGMVAEIRALRSSGATILRTMNVYNPLVNELRAAGTLDELKPYLEQINAHIAQSAQANGVSMARVYEAFNGATGEEDPHDKGYMSDAIHPDADGYAVIAELLRQLGYGPLE